MVEIGLIKGKNSNIWQEPHEERSTFLVFLRIHYASGNRNGRMVRIALFYMGLLRNGGVCYKISLCTVHKRIRLCTALFFVQSSVKYLFFTCFFRNIAVFQIVYHMKYPCRKEGMRKWSWFSLCCFVLSRSFCSRWKACRIKKACAICMLSSAPSVWKSKYVDAYL